MGLYSDILRILDNPENMSQHSRRSYWAHQIILMAREDAVQRVEALWQDECCGYKNPRICASCRAYEYVIAAIKGEQA